MRILLIVLLSMCLNVPALAADTPAIGGPFTLTDQNGKSLSSDALKGKYMLVFFGFTQCQDTCPTILLTLTQVMQQLGADSKQVVPLFISVDPDHDTPPVLKTYLSHFSPAIIGLTGTKAQLKKLQLDYKVYAGQVTDKNNNNSYIVEHSDYVFLMDREGKYVTHFTDDTTPTQIVARIQKALH